MRDETPLSIQLGFLAFGGYCLYRGIVMISDPALFLNAVISLFFGYAFTSFVIGFPPFHK